MKQLGASRTVSLFTITDLHPSISPLFLVCVCSCTCMCIHMQKQEEDLLLLLFWVLVFFEMGSLTDLELSQAFDRGRPESPSVCHRLLSPGIAGGVSPHTQHFFPLSFMY